MASIANDPNGRRRILFFDGNGKRKSIRVGKVSMRYAESVKTKIEDLVSASITGDAPRDDTARWVAGLDATMYDKLSKAGLVKPREAAMLADFTQRYIDGRHDIKPRTRINLERARRYLLDYCEAERPMRDFTAGDAEDFRQHLIGRGLAENTVRRAVGRARQFFLAAKKRGLIPSNPFEGIAASVRPTLGRFYFVSEAESRKVLAACPDAQWRVIFALTRYGGLRCPSEVLALRWEDVNWEHHRVHVPSPKTEHHEGGQSRIIPLFPELRRHLLDAFEDAEPGTQYVVTRYRDDNANLRTQFQRIIKRAGLDAWPKLFQNLRSTRETELAESFPMHVVCKWIGNSQPVAAAHYLQLTDEHFDRAVSAEAAQNAAQKMHEKAGKNMKPETGEDSQGVSDSEDSGQFPLTSGRFNGGKVPPRGLEPLLPA